MEHIRTQKQFFERQDDLQQELTMVLKKNEEINLEKDLIGKENDLLNDQIKNQENKISDQKQEIENMKKYVKDADQKLLDRKNE